MTFLLNLYKKITERIDLPFILFLLTLSSNKIYLKFFALVLIFVLRPKFNFLFNKKLPYFYPLLILLSCCQFLFFGHDFSRNHIVVFLVGTLYWLMCYAYLFQSYLFVERNSLFKINNTLVVFVLINFVFCVSDYFVICFKTDTLFPFMLGDGQYGASTGDHITGIFGRPSYVNALICSLLALYFVHLKRNVMFILASFCAMLSFANIINIVFVSVLLIYILFAGDNKRRIIIGVNIVLCFSMYLFISPDNYNYIKKTFGLSVGQQKEIMPEIVLNDTSKIVKPQTKAVYVNDAAIAQQRLVMADRSALFGKTYKEYKTYHPVDIKSSPGKKIAIIQTFDFIKESPSKLLFGAGIGNFSSRLAFQFSGRDSSRLFMKMPRYCSGYYFNNHLLIYDSMNLLPNEYHSIKHFPNNFLSQLLGEYGILGFVIFLIFYLWFFYKRAVNKFFFLIIVIPVSAYLMLDYLYEFFNIMVVVEMLLFINCKKNDSPEIQTETV